MNGGSENTPTTALPEESLRCFPIHKKNPPFLKRNLLYMSNKEDKELEAAESTNREILYHFHTTIKVKGKAQVVTHFRTDTKCPLCGVEVNDIETLWMHMTTTNNNHTFSVLKDAEGQIHIAANPERNVSQRLKRVEGTPSLAFENELIYARAWNVFCRRSTPKGVVLKSYQPEKTFEECIAENETLVPVRDYFHPLSFNKITVGEWMLLNPICYPSDDAWQVRIANCMMDDFNDVSDSEKVFLKEWNAFIRYATFIPIKQVRVKCMEFITANGAKMIEYEEHWISHLTTLWEEHQLTRQDIQIIMKHYWDTTMKAPPPSLASPAQKSTSSGGTSDST